MIRLYNHTPHPDRPIRNILTFAARVMGVKGDVLVKVTCSRGPKPSGRANRVFPYAGYMHGVADRTGRNGRLLGDLPGFVTLTIPPWENGETPWGLVCERFLDIALHEMAHIRQFRENRWYLFRQEENRRSPRRRMAHRRRPIEIDAKNMVYDATEKDRRKRRRQELVHALNESLVTRMLQDWAARCGEQELFSSGEHCAETG